MQRPLPGSSSVEHASSHAVGQVILTAGDADWRQGPQLSIRFLSPPQRLCSLITPVLAATETSSCNSGMG